MWLPYLSKHVNIMVKRTSNTSRKLFAQPIVQRRPIPDKQATNIQRQNQAHQQMAALGKKYEALQPIVEIMNPNTGQFERINSGRKFVNSFLPPDKRINMENASNMAGKVFKGNPMPQNAKNTSVMNSSYGLSKAPNPKKVSLNSNIAPNTYANDYMKSLTDLCAPMHMSGINLEIPLTGDLYSYFVQTIAFDIQTRAQANVSYFLDISNLLSSVKIVNAMNAAIRGLHVYFYYSSILAYESDPRNKNEGMINLRQNISSQILSDLARLGKRLEDTPVPPRIVEWVRYMNSNFLSGDSQGSPLLKICFDPKVLTNFTGTQINDAITALSNDANNTVYGLIRGTIPQWKIGTLYDVPVTPIFDKNFLTIFANLPAIATSATVTTNMPSSSAPSSTFSYNSFDNRLDGVAYAMCSTHRLGTGWVPGLVVPVTDGVVSSERSRHSWYGNVGSWTPVVGTPYLVASRLESTSLSAVGQQPITPHLPGAEKCQNVTAQTLVHTAQNVLDFLFRIDSIPLKGKLSHFNTKGGPNK